MATRWAIDHAVREGYLEAGTAHDAVINGAVILLIDPDRELVDLVENHDSFVVDAARCPEESGAMPGPFEFRVARGEVEAEGVGVDAVADLTGEGPKRAWVALAGDDMRYGETGWRWRCSLAEKCKREYQPSSLERPMVSSCWPGQGGGGEEESHV